MKHYQLLGLMSVILTGAAVSSLAIGVGGGIVGRAGSGAACSGGRVGAGTSSPGVVTVGRGVTGSGVAITIPGYGTAPYLVAARANFNNCGVDSQGFGTTRGFGTARGFGNTGATPGVVTVGNGVTGSGVAITIPGYGTAPYLVAAQANFANDRRFSGDINNGDGRFSRDVNQCGWRDGGQRNRNNNRSNSTVVVDSGGGGYYPSYNNQNYLGLPPWYRLNYYTPTQEELRNGTAYQDIPTSHANRGYGIPDDYPGATSYNMPTQQPNMPAAYQQPAADVDIVVGVQRELRRRGFYQGIVHGVSDASTRSAIRAFEASAGLPITGVIGIPLLRALGYF